MEGLSVGPPQGSAAEVAPAETGAGGEDFPHGSEDETLDERDCTAHGSEVEAEEETGGKFQGPGEAWFEDDVAWFKGSTEGMGTQGSAAGPQDVPVDSAVGLVPEERKQWWSLTGESADWIKIPLFKYHKVGRKIGWLENEWKNK